MALPEQKKKLLKAKIAVALHDELGRVPKKEEYRADVFTGTGHVQSGVGTAFPKARAEEKRPVSHLL
jgi:hypothetical protein